MIIFQKTLREIMQDLQDFKNDITLILSRERLDTYDSL
ncbi:CAAX protease, partial [Helicobacter pylori]